jgi:hypothetical protein
MTTNTTSTPVSPTSRKELIWEAFQEKTAELQAIRDANATAEEAKAESRIVQLSNEHGKFSVDKVIETTSKLKVSMGHQISKVGAELEQSVARLQALSEHCVLKERELKEIFDIERSASTLDALAKTQEEQKAFFRTEQRQTRDDWDREKADRNLKWSREQTEHDYNFKRKVKEETDKFKDTLAEQQKKINGEVETRLAVIAKKEEEVKANQQSTADLKDQVESLVKNHQAELEKAVADAKKSAQISAGFETRALKSDFEARITVLQGEVKTSNQQLERLNRENTNLQSQLGVANTKIQEVAMATLQSKDQKQAFDSLNKAVAGKEDSSKRK